MKKGHFHSMMTVQECSRSHTTPPFYTYYVNGNDENEMRVRSNFSNFPRFQLLREDRSPGFHISISQKRQKLKRKFTFSFWKRKVKIYYWIWIIWILLTSVSPHKRRTAKKLCKNTTLTSASNPFTSGQKFDKWRQEKSLLQNRLSKRYFPRIAL